MTRCDAFLFAIKKVMEQQRPFIDSCEVKSIQVTVSINKEGVANVNVSHRTEDTVVGCHQGNSRFDKYAFK